MYEIAIVIVLILLALMLWPPNLTSTPFNVTRKRKAGDPSNRPTAPDLAAVLTVVANKLRVTVPQAYVLNGIPQYSATGGAHTGTEEPTAVTQISPTVFDLTYAHNVAAADVVVIPSHESAIRFRTGQYVAAQTKTLA